MPKIRFLMKSPDECKKVLGRKTMVYRLEYGSYYTTKVSDFNIISEKAKTNGLNIITIRKDYSFGWIIMCRMRFSIHRDHVYMYIPIVFIDKFLDSEIIESFPHSINLI